jgi:hypothetical protein
MPGTISLCRSVAGSLTMIFAAGPVVAQPCLHHSCVASPDAQLKDANGALRGYVRLLPAPNGAGKVIFYDAQRNFVAETGPVRDVTSAVGPGDLAPSDGKADAMTEASIKSLQAQIDRLTEKYNGLVKKLTGAR